MEQFCQEEVLLTDAPCTGKTEQGAFVGLELNHWTFLSLCHSCSSRPALHLDLTRHQDHMTATKASATRQRQRDAKIKEGAKLN